MSDGPHRSLPLRRHWKKLAERAETPSYSISEVTNAFSRALWMEFREAHGSLMHIRDIFIGDRQYSLLHKDSADQLEAVRRTFPGSTAVNILVDCAIEANINKFAGPVAFITALENALEAFARGTCHQIEEHYIRKEPISLGNIRARLRTASQQVPYNAIASEIAAGKAAINDKFHLTRRTGIDEGPSI